MRTLKLLVLASTLLWAGAARASGVPHDATFNGDCEACHKLHTSVGGTMTYYSSNNLACLGCHGTKSAPNTKIGTWSAGQQAVPDTSGVHHRWDAPAVSAAHGATTPAAPMLGYLEGGTVACGTCHDPHPVNQTFAFRPFISMATGVATAPITGTGTLTVDPVGASSASKAYMLQVSQYTGTTSFKVVMSNDNGKSWWKLNTGPTWAAATGVNDTSGSLVWNVTTKQPLNDGTNVNVLVSGTPSVGSYWKFYVSYPFLRDGSTDANGICIKCHQARNMAATCVEGSGNDGSGASCAAGTKVYSHPVGDQMGLGTGSTKAVGAVLDADGTTQGSDGNPTNDFFFDATGRVGCISCHSPHNADSNSLSVDAR